MPDREDAGIEDYLHLSELIGLDWVRLMLDYRLMLWAPTSASCAISAVAEFLLTSWYQLESMSKSNYSSLCRPTVVMQKLDDEKSD